MIRLAFAALALVLPAAVSAQHHVSATPGAVAGRSPHTAFRVAAKDTTATAGALSGAAGPAGRLATHSAAARPDPSCSAVRLADREESRTTDRD